MKCSEFIFSKATENTIHFLDYNKYPQHHKEKSPFVGENVIIAPTKYKSINLMNNNLKMRSTEKMIMITDGRGESVLPALEREGTRCRSVRSCADFLQPRDLILTGRGAAFALSMLQKANWHQWKSAYKSAVLGALRGFLPLKLKRLSPALFHPVLPKV